MKKPIAPIDNSIPLLTHEGAERLLVNENRGFRLELYITLAKGTAYPADGIDAYVFLKSQLELYKDDKVNFAQVYVYLCEYFDKDLDEKAFEELDRYLGEVKKSGLHILLRFCYEYDETVMCAPKMKQVERHLNQIAQWSASREKQLKDAIAAVQMGIIGLWGEGHTSRYKLDAAKIWEGLLRAFPTARFQARTPKLRNFAPLSERKEIGYHEDFLFGKPHKWDMFEASKKARMEEGDFSGYFNDGELPWGSYSEKGSNKIDGEGVCRQAADLCLSSMSLVHNYKEKGGSFNMQRWKEEYILQDTELPLNPALCDNGKISVFDYLKYHLGYQLVLSNLCFSQKKSKIKFMLTNYGMAAPFFADKICVIISSNGKTQEFETHFKGELLTSCAQMLVETDLKRPLAAGEMVGVKIYSNEIDGIKTANDVLFVQGVNYIYKN